MGIGVGLISLIPGYLWALYAMFLLLGSITSGATPLPYGRAISSWFNRRRGLALGLGMAGTGLGTLILPIFSQQLIDAYGWRMAFAIVPTLTDQADNNTCPEKHNWYHRLTVSDESS